MDASSAGCTSERRAIEAHGWVPLYKPSLRSFTRATFSTGTCLFAVVLAIGVAYTVSPGFRYWSSVHATVTARHTPPTLLGERMHDGGKIDKRKTSRVTRLRGGSMRFIGGFSFKVAEGIFT